MATRKVKDAKDLTSNELIYFKGHAQATYMSDGSTVEDTINNIINNSGSGSGGATDSTILYFDIYTAENLEWVDDENNVKGNGTLSQEDYDAYYTAIERGKFGILWNEFYLQNIYLEESSYTYISIRSVFYDEAFEKFRCIKLNINRNDLSWSVLTEFVESGNGGTSSSYKKLVTSTSSNMMLGPNVYYRNTNTSLSSLAITLVPELNNSILNEYFVEFTTSSAGTAVGFPTTIKWANGETPTFVANKIYQVSIINNLGIVVQFDNGIPQGGAPGGGTE